MADRNKTRLRCEEAVAPSSFNLPFLLFPALSLLYPHSRNFLQHVHMSGQQWLLRRQNSQQLLLQLKHIVHLPCGFQMQLWGPAGQCKERQMELVDDWTNYMSAVFHLWNDGINVYFFFFLRQSLSLLPGLKCCGAISAHCNLASQVQAILLPQPPK